jgi:hypothetical protein
MLKTSVINSSVRAGGEDGLVTDRAVRQIAERHLHDVGRDGGRWLHRVPGQIRLHAGGHSENHRFADGA